MSWHIIRFPLRQLAARKKQGAPFVGPGKTQRVEPEKMERWFARQQGV